LGGVVRPSFLVVLLLGAACGGPLPVGDPDGGRDGSWVEDATSPPDDAVAPPDGPVCRRRGGRSEDCGTT
jgi:hypothetical protein